MKKVITAPENQLLNRFFKALTPSINVSRDHLNRIKRLLIPIKEEFVNCILKLEEDYIKVQQESLPHYYQEMKTQTGSELAPEPDKILELVPWRLYFKNQIFEWDGYYSPILMYKVLVWSRLRKVDGCLKIRNEIHSEIEGSNGYVHKVGQILGFIKNVPGKTKLYTFFNKLEYDNLYKTIENQAKSLMKRYDAAHIILTIDLSSLKARKNDPSLSEDTKENSNRKKNA